MSTAVTMIYRLYFCIFSIVMCLSLIPIVNAQPQISGYLEYQVRNTVRENKDGSEVETTMQNSTLRIDAATALWQPWIAQLNGGVGVTFNTLDADEGDQESWLTTGDIKFRLFPRSHFPFELFAERRDSRVEGDLVDTDSSTDYYGFTQRYSPVGGMSYTLNYRHAENEDQRPQINQATRIIGTTNDLVNLSISKTLQHHDLDFDSDYLRTERKESSQEDTRLLHLLRHRYRPGTTFSMNNLLSFTDSEFMADTAETTTERIQLSTTALWRPRTKRPLSVSVTALALQNQSESGGSDTESESLIFNGGMNYQWTPALNLRARSNVNQIKTGDDEDLTTLFSVGALYSPRSIKLGSFDYRWSLLGDVVNRTGIEDEETGQDEAQEAVISASHGLGRTAPLYGGTFSFNMGQRVSHLEDTLDREEDAVAHNASLAWNHRGNKASTLMQITASDNRRYSDEDSVSQLANLQISRNHQVDRLSSWSGNLTVQGSRFEDVNNLGDWLVTASVNLAYRNQSLFGVPRLSFNTGVRYTSDDLVSEIEIEDEFDNEALGETFAWENRFDYRIGRLSLRFDADLTERDEEMDMLLLFSARRSF